jgi:lysophospholipase L1-like esterase
MLSSAFAQKIRVACMGDSITYGAGITGAGTSPATWEGDKVTASGPTLLDQDSYPSVLQDLLGEGYDVRNFGASGRTVTGPGPGLFPYLNSVRDGNTPSGGYTAGVAFAPDVILVMLGTNDTKLTLWASAQPRFKTDYINMVRALQNLPSKPYVVICYPVPVEDAPKTNPASGITESNRQLLLPIINEVVAETGAGFINTNAGMPAFTGLLSDQVHPNHAGAVQLASIMDAGFPMVSVNPVTNEKTPLGTRPRVSITAPADRSVVVAPAGFTLTADASPETVTGTGIGTNAPSPVVLPVTKVEFFNGSTKIGESTSAPFSATIQGLAPGAYSIRARATNSAGLTRDSRPITVFVSAQAMPAGAVPFTGSYSENFDSLVREVKAGTLPWSNDQTLPGWSAFSFASSTWTPASAYQGDDGGSNVAAMKSLGANWARNRSFGTISSSSRMVWGVCLANATTAPIQQITLQYTGEHWRVSSTTANNRDITFEFSASATTLGSSTGYTAVSALTFAPPNKVSATTTKLDGKLAANRNTLQQTFSIPGGWQPGARLWLRWSTGSSQSSTVAIDDVTVIGGGGNPISPAISPEGEAFRIQWLGTAGSTYVVETCTDLAAGNWTTASPNIPLSGNGTVLGSFLYTAGMNGSNKRFFRVRLAQ